MNFNQIKERITSENLFCLLFGHKIKTSRSITNHFKEYKCSRCNLELTNDDHGHLLFLTPELKEVNEALVYFHRKKSLAS